MSWVYAALSLGPVGTRALTWVFTAGRGPNGGCPVPLRWDQPRPQKCRSGRVVPIGPIKTAT